MRGFHLWDLYIPIGTLWTNRWPCGSGNDPLEQQNGSRGWVWR